MENAVDALKMAAAVLIFIIAIGTSFSLFGTAKKTADSIIGMRDKQKYLEAAELDGGILYTSSTKIAEEENIGSVKSKISGVTTHGDRIVKIDDVISTLYRYDIEKYGVTIADETGKVLVRFDSNTENLMRQYYNIDFTNDEFKKYIKALNDNVNFNVKDTYGVEIKYEYIDKNNNTLQSLYKVTTNGNNKINCGAPWYGNASEIQRRVDCEISGEKYEYNSQYFTRSNDLFNILNNDSNTIIEVINEIDTSKYLNDDADGKTNLLQQYQIPTIEIVYLVKN